MDYLSTRWFLVKKLSDDKIKIFHSLETAAFNYAARARKTYKADKVTPPLWWQSASAFLWAEAGFYKYCARGNYVREIDFFAAFVRNALPGIGVVPAELFGSIKLMHQCDLLVRTLPYTNHLTTLSSTSLPSSQRTLA
ncbi:MAG: hypothetical protein FWF35_02040 [Elusimicrobia bacterium]|nr:hypothetical protein [Elusimicrobiota bacterium]